MRQRFVVAITAALTASAFAGATADAAGPRQSGTVTFTSRVPGTATGTVASLAFQNPENATQKPHAVARMVIHAPQGAITDTTVPPQCHASDAQLYVEGAAACPPDTKIGGGVAVSDSGGGGPFPRYTEATITDFNTQGGVIGFGQVSNPPIRSVDHTTINGTTSTTDFPAFPGVPPPDPFTPIKSLNITFPAYSRGGRTYARTPPSCPSIGYWRFTIDFTYRDGVTQSIESHSPCQRNAQPQHLSGKHRPAKKRRHRRHRRHHRRRAASFTG
jgi:hypothetical protein